MFEEINFAKANPLSMLEVLLYDLILYPKSRGISTYFRLTD
jgi:hypothetical protein